MLQVGKSFIQETYYDILSVKEDASYDEIRASYKAAVLNSHPDKLNIKNKEFEHHPKMNERFLKVQKAWEVLGDSEFRAIYDKELRASRPGLVLADEVELKEMMLEDSGDALELFYPCRCGDNFSITSDELEEAGFLLDGNGRVEIQGSNIAPASIIIPCCSCSLKICLVID